MITENGHQGAVVIVTGASAGLGRQLAGALAGAGAIPVLAARPADPAAHQLAGALAAAAAIPVLAAWRADRLAGVRAELPGADGVPSDVTGGGDRECIV